MHPPLGCTCQVKVSYPEQGLGGGLPPVAAAIGGAVAVKALPIGVQARQRLADRGALPGRGVGHPDAGDTVDQSSRLAQQGLAQGSISKALSVLHYQLRIPLKYKRLLKNKNLCKWSSLHLVR